MLAKSLRSHSLYNYARYILSYIKIVYKPRNIPVQMKDECKPLIKTVVFIEHNVKAISVHGLYSRWKSSHFCMGRAQSIQCAVTQYSRAVGCHHMWPALTDTHLVNPPIKPSVGYPVGSFTKNWFSCEQNQPFKEDVCCCLSWLSVIVCALVQNKAPFFDPSVSCRTPC